MYERACPSNHFLLTPMTGLVISLALLYALQVTFLTNLDISAVLAVQSRPEILRTEDVPT